MAKVSMAFAELVEKGAQDDVVCELLGYVAERLIEFEIEQRTGVEYGARSSERANSRNGYRDRFRARRCERCTRAVGDRRRSKLRGKWSKPAAMMESSRDEVLAYMTFAKAHRTQIASTNPLERINAEIKRRTDVVGIFPNDPAIVRLVGALLLEQNDEWQLQRRYMQLEGLKTVSDNSAHRLSGVVTR